MQQDLETVYPPNPERRTFASGHDDGHRSIAEYVPEGQEIESWRELIAIEALDDRMPQEAPKATMTKLKAAMEKRGGKLEWNGIEEDASSALYEWAIRGASGVEDQGEIARLVQGIDAMHRAAYAYESVPLAAERRLKFTGTVRNARVVNGEKDMLAAQDEAFPGWRDER